MQLVFSGSLVELATEIARGMDAREGTGTLHQDQLNTELLPRLQAIHPEVRAMTDAARLQVYREGAAIRIEAVLDDQQETVWAGILPESEDWREDAHFIGLLLGIQHGTLDLLTQPG